MDREFDLSLLRTFVTLATTGSFTATGHRLFRTQPAISQRIRRLEDQLGYPLIARAADGLSLTREGGLLLNYAKRLLSLNDEAMRKLLSETPPDVIRLGLPEEYGARGLETVLERFAAHRPGVSVTIELRLSDEIRNGFEKGLYDVVLNSSALSAAYHRVPLVWVESKHGHMPLEGAVPLILFAEGSIYRRTVLDSMAASSQSWQIVCSSSSRWGVRSAIHAGLGISAIGIDMLDDSMRVVQEHDGLPRLPEMGLAVGWLSHGSTEAVKAFARLLMESLRDTPDHRSEGSGQAE